MSIHSHCTALSTVPEGLGRLNKPDIWDESLKDRKRSGKQNKGLKTWGYKLLIDGNRRRREIWISKEQRSQALNSKWTGIQKRKSIRSLHYHDPRAQERWNLSFNLFFFFPFISFFLWQPSPRLLEFRFFMRLYLEYPKAYPKPMFLSETLKFTAFCLNWPWFSLPYW